MNNNVGMGTKHIGMAVVRRNRVVLVNQVISHLDYQSTQVLLIIQRTYASCLFEKFVWLTRIILFFVIAVILTLLFIQRSVFSSFFGGEKLYQLTSMVDNYIDKFMNHHQNSGKLITDHVTLSQSDHTNSVT